MSSAIPPPLPPAAQSPASQSYDAPPQRPGWWQRHWKWAVPLLLLLMLALFAGFVYLLISMIGSGMRNNDAYRIAYEQARSDPRVIAALGEPIEQKGFISGRIAANSYADLRVPISGPLAEGALFIEAHTRTGVWKFTTLAVTPDGSDAPIDLLPGLPPQRRAAPEETDDARTQNGDDEF